MISRAVVGMLLLASATASAQTVSGTVISRSTQQPVAQVIVSLLHANGAVLRGVTTDGSGRYSFELPATGEHRIRAERFGFHTYFGELLQVSSTGIRLDVQLQDSVIPLSPVTVPAAVRGRRLSSVGLYERAQAGIGTFIMREEIEKRQPLKVTDLLQGRAGIRVIQPPRANSVVSRDVVMRGGGSLRSKCLPRLYLDGVLVRSGGPDINSLTIVLDEVAKPDDIEGIEVYKSAAQVPAHYGGANSACGVVLIWTRTN